MSETGDVYFLLYTGAVTGEWWSHGSYAEAKAEEVFAGFAASRTQRNNPVPLQMILLRLHPLSGNVDVVRRYPEATASVAHHTEG